MPRDDTKAEDDPVEPFKAAVACLKAGAAADKKASADRAQRVEAVRQYRTGLAHIVAVGASGKYKREVIAALLNSEEIAELALAPAANGSGKPEEGPASTTSSNTDSVPRPAGVFKPPPRPGSVFTPPPRPTGHSVSATSASSPADIHVAAKGPLESEGGAPKDSAETQIATGQTADRENATKHVEDHAVKAAAQLKAEEEAEAARIQAEEEEAAAARAAEEAAAQLKAEEEAEAARIQAEEEEAAAARAAEEAAAQLKAEEEAEAARIQAEEEEEAAAARAAEEAAAQPKPQLESSEMKTPPLPVAQAWQRANVVPNSLRQRRPSIAIAEQSARGPRQAFLELERRLALEQKVQESKQGGADGAGGAGGGERSHLSQTVASGKAEVTATDQAEQAKEFQQARRTLVDGTHSGQRHAGQVQVHSVEESEQPEAEHAAGAVPMQHAGAVAHSGRQRALDLSFVEEKNAEEDQDMEDSEYDPSGVSSGYHLGASSTRSNDSTIDLGSLDVSALEIPRLTPTAHRQLRQQQQQHTTHSDGAHMDPGPSASMMDFEKAKQTRQLKRQARDNERLLAREKQRDERQAALQALVRTQPQPQQPDGASVIDIVGAESRVETNGDLRRRKIIAAWEASEAEMLDRTAALRELVRQADEKASTASVQAADDAAEEEADFLQRQREAIGLTASGLRISGLPPGCRAGSTPFEWLHGPMVAATANLVLPGVAQTSSLTGTDDDNNNSTEMSKAVLEHLGKNLGRKGHSAYSDAQAQTCAPIFGALAAAQGSLCETLVSWAAADEARMMTIPSPDLETNAQAAISELLLSRAGAVAMSKARVNDD
eukprot:COSAG02_NODE_3085_length_7396_cov_7.466082_2_plen_833_part_00